MESGTGDSEGTDLFILSLSHAAIFPLKDELDSARGCFWVPWRIEVEGRIGIAILGAQRESTGRNSIIRRTPVQA
jgi:hypothetical protein